MSDEKVRFNVQMPESLRSDAKAKTERGELAEEVRDLFRRKAYGMGSGESSTELERKKAELESVRNDIDNLRHRRRQTDAKIETKEARAARLEEQIAEMEEQRDEVKQSLRMLENMIRNGERLWPKKIENYADVDAQLAEEMHHDLQDELGEVPEAAFEKPTRDEAADWRVAERSV